MKKYKIPLHYIQIFRFTIYFYKFLYLSIFKSKWIILKINKLANKESIISIFTYDFWLIKCISKYSKTQKPLDIWYLINFEIETKQEKDLHKIRNVKIKWEFNTENKSFSQINAYLELISFTMQNLAPWVPIFELFNLFEIVLKKEEMDYTKLVLAKLKAKNILWELNISNSDQTIAKILKFISQNKISEILRLTWISDDIVSKLAKLM